MNTPPLAEYQPARAHPRLPVTTPLQVKLDGQAWVWNTIDISVGGLGFQCPAAPPPPSTKLKLLFNLPNGYSVSTEGVVRYVLSDRVGVQFSDLPSESRSALEDYTYRAMSYTRDGGRIAKRLYVTLTSVTSGSEEQIAETVILSRNGGLLICRAAFKVGEELRLTWSERHRSARIAVTFRRECGAGGLAELGFALRDVNDFWQMEFPPS